MSKQPKGPTFADIVREVERQPAAPVVDRSGVISPDGTRWHQEMAQINAAHAVDLVANGAHVAWDRCGCGGYCGFDWYTPEDEAQMAKAGTPRVRANKKQRGNLSLWTSDAGGLLVVAEDAVQWGDAIDG